jgi:hypothetical protein
MVATAIVLILAAQSATALEWDGGRADAMAPIGLHGATLEEAGSVTLSYRLMRNVHYGYRVGVDSVALDDVVADYDVVPTDLAIMEHVFGIQVGATDMLTISALIPISDREMEHEEILPAFTTQTSGIGDISVAALLGVVDGDRQRFHFSLGAYLPTGGIDEVGPVAGGDDAQLPYAMQPGTGVVALRPGFTYQGQNDIISWGIQFNGTFSLGENDRDYHWGTRGTLDTWIAGSWAPWISSSFRLTYDRWGLMEGADGALDPAQSPANDAALQSKTEINGWMGVNLYAPSGPLSGARLAIEGGIPMYMLLDGPQLRSRWMLNVGAQWSFSLLGG